MNKLSPLVSIIVPTFNEEKNIGKCLRSIFMQDYPSNKLEVIIVDDLSTDRTLEIAREFKVKVLLSGKKHAEISKMKGFKEASGEFAVYLDADIELRGTDWLNKMITPLLKNSEIIGSFTRYYSKRDDPAIERYLCFDELQRDSVYQFFSPSIDQTVISKNDGYSICQYNEDKIPPAGLCLYRREKLLSLVKDYDMFLELDFLVLLVKQGFNKFAYVPEAGLYHHHATSLKQLINKRRYNLTKVYLAREERLYKWFDSNSINGLLKILVWIIFANLILPSILMGIYKSIRYKDSAGLYEPIVNFLITDIIVLEFLKNSKGRKLLLNKEN